MGSLPRPKSRWCALEQANFVTRQDPGVVTVLPLLTVNCRTLHCGCIQVSAHLISFPTGTWSHSIVLVQHENSQAYLLEIRDCRTGRLPDP